MIPNPHHLLPAPITGHHPALPRPSVLTCIRREWGHTGNPVPREVDRLRVEAQGRTLPWTGPELAPFADAPAPF